MKSEKYYIQIKEEFEKIIKQNKDPHFRKAAIKISDYTYDFFEPTNDVDAKLENTILSHLSNKNGLYNSQIYNLLKKIGKTSEEFKQRFINKSSSVFWMIQDINDDHQMEFVKKSLLYKTGVIFTYQNSFSYCKYIAPTVQDYMLSQKTNMVKYIPNLTKKNIDKYLSETTFLHNLKKEQIFLFDEIQIERILSQNFDKYYSKLLCNPHAIRKVLYLAKKDNKFNDELKELLNDNKQNYRFLNFHGARFLIMFVLKQPNLEPRFLYELQSNPDINKLFGLKIRNHKSYAHVASLILSEIEKNEADE